MLNFNHPPNGTLSIQLCLKGAPTAFDVNPTNDIAVVSSRGAMTFFHLNRLATPKHIIYYDEPCPVQKVSFRFDGHLATLRDGNISIWEPFHNIKQLISVVPGVDRYLNNYYHI